MSSLLSHSYPEEGLYTVIITGTIEGFNFTIHTSRDYIREIKQWGNLILGDGDRHFEDCKHFTIAADAGKPDLSKTTSFKRLFKNTEKFNTNISHWDTKHITDMSEMFHNATAFNQPVRFNADKVKDMNSMFKGATAFNSEVVLVALEATNMSHMFEKATAFNSEVRLYTPEVTNMSYMFAEAEKFNQPITTFKTLKVKDVSLMFYKAKAFNSEIRYREEDYHTRIHSPYNDYSYARFDLSNVENMAGMFAEATSYNQYPYFGVLCGLTHESQIQAVFYGASSFKQNLRKGTDEHPRWEIPYIMVLQEFIDVSFFRKSGITNPFHLSGYRPKFKTGKEHCE